MSKHLSPAHADSSMSLKKTMGNALNATYMCNTETDSIEIQPLFCEAFIKVSWVTSSCHDLSSHHLCLPHHILRSTNLPPPSSASSSPLLLMASRQEDANSFSCGWPLWHTSVNAQKQLAVLLLRSLHCALASKPSIGIDSHALYVAAVVLGERPHLQCFDLSPFFDLLEIARTRSVCCPQTHFAEIVAVRV